MDADNCTEVPLQANGDHSEGVEDENAGGTWDQSQQGVVVISLTRVKVFSRSL